MIDFAGINPVKALIWSAIVNGLLAPFVLVAVLIIATDYNLMHKKPSSPLALATVALTTLLMFAAAVGMFVF